MASKISGNSYSGNDVVDTVGEGLVLGLAVVGAIKVGQSVFKEEAPKDLKAHKKVWNKVKRMFGANV